MEEHALTLRVVLDILMACNVSLHERGTERDQEIADLLQYCANGGRQEASDAMRGLANRRQGI